MKETSLVNQWWELQMLKTTIVDDSQKARMAIVSRYEKYKADGGSKIDEELEQWASEVNPMRLTVSCYYAKDGVNHPCTPSFAYILTEVIMILQSHEDVPSTNTFEKLTGDPLDIANYLHYFWLESEYNLDAAISIGLRKYCEDDIDINEEDGIDIDEDDYDDNDCN